MTDPAVFVSGFRERGDESRGGIFSLTGDRAAELYRGRGIFGLCFLSRQNVLLGATRDATIPLVALRMAEGTAPQPLPIEYRNFIPSLRTHGIASYGEHLYIVAAQGEPGSEMSTNTDRWANHRVGKVIISRFVSDGTGLTISDSRAWNPFRCRHHHHINDVLVDQQFIYLVSFSTCLDGVTSVPGGAISRFSHDFELHSILTRELDSPHSLQFHDGRLFTCSSGSSSVHSILPDDPTSLRLEYKSLNNFVRGLVVTDAALYIGLSRSSGRTDAAHLTDSINGVLRFDRYDGTTVRIPLPDDFENTYAIVTAREPWIARLLPKGAKASRASTTFLSKLKRRLAR